MIRICIYGHNTKECKVCFLPYSPALSVVSVSEAKITCCQQVYRPCVSRLITLPKGTVGAVIMLVRKLPLISYNTHRNTWTKCSNVQNVLAGKRTETILNDYQKAGLNDVLWEWRRIKTTKQFKIHMDLLISYMMQNWLTSVL